MFLYRLNIFNFKEIKVFTVNNFKKIFFLNDKNFFTININNTTNEFYINNSTKSLIINLVKKKQLIAFFNQLQFIFTNMYKSFFLKLNLLVKVIGYNLFKKKIMNFTFGYSHIYLMHLGGVKYKRINKYRYFFELYDLERVNKLKNLFKAIKPINKYTLRGLRLTRASIVKRKGRKSPNI